MVFLPPVRGGVLDAPRLRDRRAALDAPVRPDRLHPRLIRRANLASIAPRIQSRGRSPRTISYGRPTLSVDRGRAGVEARPYGGWVARVDGLRDYTAPTLHQPLSHGALRRDSSPFRGAEGWAEVCGVYAFVYRDADAVVFLPPVRGGVLDAPRLRDRRAALDAPVRPDRLHPRLIRRANLASIAPRIQSRGRSPRTISYGRNDVVLHRRPGGRGSPPLRCVGKYQRATGVVGHPKEGASGTPPPTVGAKEHVSAKP